jgi:pilus assembly protein CpaB
MNRRILTIVVCALLLSVCASYLVYRAVGARAPAGKPQAIAELVVASRDLVVGTLIHEGDVRMAGRLGSPPTGAILARDSALNRGVVSAIYEGEPVTENRLAPKGSGGGLAATIPPGMRACAVRVNEVVGVAGFVVPGMRVDVLISGLPPGGSALEGPKVRTLLQDIQVLSAGINFQKDQEGKPEQAQVVNLLVTPAQAEILSLASNETHIQLVLRNPMDTEISGLPGTRLSDLFAVGRAPESATSDHSKSPAPVPIYPPLPAAAVAPTVAVPPVPALYTIEVLNGSVHTQAKFSRPMGKQ